MPADTKENHTAFHEPFPLSGPGSGLGQLSDPDRRNSIDDLPTAYELADPVSGGGYMGLTVSAGRLRLFFLVLAAGLLIMAARLAQVQLVQGEQYQKRAEGNRTRVVWSPSQRGILYDRNGKTLVSNVPHFSATLRTADLITGSDKEPLISRLAGILDMTADDLRSQIADSDARGGGAVILKDGLSHDQAVLLAIEAARTPAVALVVGTRREYLVTKEIASLSHVIGFQGRPTDAELASTGPHYLPSDFVGKTGLEKYYETTLRGTYGKQTFEIDALGRRKKMISEEAGAPGQNLVLSIDLGLQLQAERILKEQLRSEGKTRGSVVVLSPKTGEILALVSTPDFDNNLFAKGISSKDFQALLDNKDNPMFPRSIAASLPSGSTFKLVVAAAALEEGVVGPNTTVLSTGGISVDKWYFPDWKAGGHGPTNVVKAIAESVNTFFYAVGGGLDKLEGLGVDRIIAYAGKFGLGKPLGIDLVGEGAGFLPSKDWKETTKGEHWYIGDTYHLAIGQGDILVTPLQIASMTSVFANGGRLIRPRVVNATTTSAGDRILREPEIISEQVVSREAVDVVRRGMRQAVVSGSARSMSGLPVAVAAKTGTAQWSSSREPHAWFTSFAPYNDPKLVVTVVIEEGGEGSVTAAPVAARLYAWYFGNRAAQP